jgi:hypothetical protein
MSNFKVNFLAPDGKSYNGVTTLTNCCCPNVIDVVCTDMTVGKEYTVYFDNSTSYMAKVFPETHSFIATGQLVGFKVISAGYDFGTEVPSIVITGGGATRDAKATATIGDIKIGDNTTKGITSIKIDDPGSGYVSLPDVTIVGGGSGKGVFLLPILGNAIKNLSFFISFVCDDRKMPIPTPYPSTTPTITPTPTHTVTPTPMYPTPTPSPIGFITIDLEETTTYTTSNGLSINLLNYFDPLVNNYIYAYIGKVGQNLQIPLNLGEPDAVNLAVHISNTSEISLQNVEVGQTIPFQSDILLGYSENLIIDGGTV